jgi:hypothetical protein
MRLSAAVLLCSITMLASGPHQPSADAGSSYVRHAVRAADYVLSLQDERGAIHDAVDNPGINMDNNMGYALTALMAVYQATGDPRYVSAVREGLRWLASVQDADGSWHWGYRVHGAAADGDYRPFVGEYYRERGITGIKSVDAIQAYFAYNLYLYRQAGGDARFVEQMLPTARRGIESLIARNYDGRLFFSSWQQRAGQWRRLRTHFSAGQADVYLGLIGMMKLTQEPRYGMIAERVRAHLPVFLSDDVWATSLTNNQPYRFSNGYLSHVFETRSGLVWLGNNQDGSAIAAAALALGRQAVGETGGPALGTLRMLQTEHGGVAFSDRAPFNRYFYTNDAAFAILSWLGVGPAFKQ